MIKEQLLYLVFYDIENSRLRACISKRLIARGYERLQFSVFVGVQPPWENKRLWIVLQGMVAKDGQPSDKVYSIQIHKTAFKNMKTIGSFTWDIEYLAGDMHTLLLQGKE